MKVCKLLILFALFFAAGSFSIATAQQHCTSDGKRFSSCIDLPYFNASLLWNYNNSTNGSALVDVAFTRHGLTERRWIAWAINPTGSGMIGAQALVAFRKTDVTLYAYTSPITSYRTRLEKGALNFPVYDVYASFDNNDMTIFATLQLPRPVNSTSHVVNHLWQEGPLNGDTPGMHNVSPSSPNVKSFGTLDFLSGITIASQKGVGTSSRTILKYIHGGLNTVSWGIMMPTGAVIARHLKMVKSADPLWFYLHVGCQISASLLGGVGFFTGLYLGLKYGMLHAAHLSIGIVLFCLAMSQVLVGVFMRPKKDSEKRKYFNWFHYLVGYSTIVLSVANIFEGFRILQAVSIWRTAYIGVIAAIACMALFLEAYRCYMINLKSSKEKNLSTAPAARDLV